MIPAVCVDATNRPEEIPMGKWIQQGFTYHITHIYYHPLQGIQGCVLHEVKLSHELYGYDSFRLNRFRFTQENLAKLVQMMIDCSELNEFDVHKLLRQCEVEVMEEK